MKKIKRGDLLPWFLEDHATLPAWYLEDCKKFFRELKNLKLARLTAENVQKKNNV